MIIKEDTKAYDRMSARFAKWDSMTLEAISKECLHIIGNIN